MGLVLTNRGESHSANDLSKLYTLMKNLQFTIRILSRNPLLVFVNIPGLAVGLSVVLLLLVYLEHELSFDQHFETKERVLRLNSEVSNQNGSGIYGISLRDAYNVIPDEVPEVEAATQLYRWLPVRVKSKTEIFSGMKLLFAWGGTHYRGGIA